MATTKRTARKTARTVRQTGRKVARTARKTGRKVASATRETGRKVATPLARQDARWHALRARPRERLLHNPSSSLSEEPRPYPPGFFFVVRNCGQLA